MVARRIRIGDTSAVATALHLTSPNDFSHASWTTGPLSTNCPGTGELAPDGVATTASPVNSTVTGGYAATRTTIPITMVSMTHYSLTGYVKSIVTPVWLLVTIIDSLSSPTGYAQFWINATAGSGAAGDSLGTTGGVIDSFAVTAAGNNYSKVDMAFHYSSTPSADNSIDLVFSDGNRPNFAPTNLQKFHLWGWGA